MADLQIILGGNSIPDKTLILNKFWDAEDPTSPQDISTWTIKLQVKRDPDDATPFIDLTATNVTAASGSYKYPFTIGHTSMPARTYVGVEKIWDVASPGATRPRFTRTVELIITKKI